VIGSWVLAIALSQVEPVPRLRAELPNKTRIFVERTSAINTVTVELYAANLSSIETKDQHGFRHLVEHLACRGKDRLLDRKLESKGLYLTASTTRDGMAIQITGPSEHVGLAMDAVMEVATSFECTPEQIAKEVTILKEELAIISPAHLTAVTAWETFFGDQGLDAYGNPEVMATATPEQLKEVHRRQFLPAGLALVVIGDIAVDPVMTRAKSLLESRGGDEPSGSARFGDDTPSRVMSKSPGEARAVLVQGFPEVSTMSALAAALVFQSEIDGLQTIYTVSGRAGVVSLTCPDAGILGGIDELTLPQRTALVARARQLAAIYMRSQIQDRARYAHLLAVLLRDHPGLTPEDLLNQANGLTTEQILNGMRMFNRDECVRVSG